MAYFNTNVPPLSRKPTNVDLKNYPGAWRINLKIGNNTLYSTFYTKLDQACIFWGIISVGIFFTAQFFPINWGMQAIFWSVLTLVGTVAMVELTRTLIKEEPFRGILYCWIILMVGGTILTDFSIFLGWGEVLIRLCPLWLLLNALGYAYTGMAMRSRTFLFTSLAHLLGILILPFLANWQFLITGAVIGLSVLILAEFQWDTTASCNGNSAKYDDFIAEEKQFQPSQVMGQ